MSRPHPPRSPFRTSQFQRERAKAEKSQVADEKGPTPDTNESEAPDDPSAATQATEAAARALGLSPRPLP